MIASLPGVQPVRAELRRRFPHSQVGPRHVLPAAWTGTSVWGLLTPLCQHPTLPLQFSTWKQKAWGPSPPQTGLRGCSGPVVSLAQFPAPRSILNATQNGAKCRRRKSLLLQPQEIRSGLLLTLVL